MKSIVFKALYVLAFVLLITNTVFAALQSLNPDINDLPDGRLIESFNSPSGASRIDIYLVSNSIGTAIRGEYVSDKGNKNIYWQTGISGAEVEWLSEKSIIINRVPLNVKTDKFDSRRGTAIFSEGVLAENIS